MSEGCASDFNERDRELPHDGDAGEALAATGDATGYPVAPDLSGQWYRKGALVSCLCTALAGASLLVGLDFFAGLFTGLGICVAMTLWVAWRVDLVAAPIAGE